MKKLILVLFALWLTTGVEAQWTESLNKPATCFYPGDIGKNTMYAGLPNGIFCKTMDNGLTWVGLDSLGHSPRCIIRGTYNEWYIGTASNGIYKSDTSGRNFTQYALPGVCVLSLRRTGSTIMLAGTNNGIYRSTDNGLTWDVPQLGGLQINNFENIQIGLTIATSNGIWKSTDNGVSWTQLTNFVTHKNVKFVANLGLSAIVAGTSNGYLRSTDNGQNWSSVSHVAMLSCINLGNSHFLMGDSIGNIYHGQPPNLILQELWERNAGMPSTSINCMAIIHTSTGLNEWVFVGSSGNSQKIWRAPKNYVISVKKISEQIPVLYSLSQNYPNPFNPQTEIRYTVPTKSFVSVKVYDALGRMVATLVNETQTPGTYEVKWNASTQTSGVYYYQLQTGDYSETKKMLLIK